MFLNQNKFKLNFFKKLFLLMVGIVFFTIILNFIFNTLFLDKFYIHSKKNEIMNAKHEIVQILENEHKEKLDNYLEYLRDTQGIRVSIHKKNSRMPMHTNRKIYSSLKIGEGVLKIGNIENPSGVTFISYYERLENNDFLVIRSSMAVMESQLEKIFIFNIFTTIISLLISGIAISIFTKKINNNITYLKDSAYKISKLEYPEKIKLNSGDELEELSNSLNEMSKDLSFSIENLKSFVSNASHELKTPISVLCLYSQALSKGNLSEEKKQKYYDVIFSKSLEMKTLIESLLTISSLNSIDYKVKNDEISVITLINEAFEQFDYLEFEKNIDVVLDLKSIENLKVSGDTAMIKMAINNLVQNMLKYSPENEEVKIVFSNGELIFKNKILGEIKEEVSKLFEPFSRGENSMNYSIDGNGLGLSIVKKVLELHKFSYEALVHNNEFIFKINFFKI